MGVRPDLKPAQRTVQPPMYRVLLLNDDYTPMDFVLFVLKRYFGKSDGEAQHIMLEAHQQGLSTAGIYNFEIAEVKVKQVERHASREGYPLRLALEPA